MGPRSISVGHKMVEIKNSELTMSLPVSFRTVISSIFPTPPSLESAAIASGATQKTKTEYEKKGEKELLIGEIAAV